MQSPDTRFELPGMVPRTIGVPFDGLALILSDDDADMLMLVAMAMMRKGGRVGLSTKRMMAG